MLRDSTSELHQRAEDALQAHSPIESRLGLRHFLSCMLNSHTRYHAECDHASELANLELRSTRLIGALHLDLGISQEVVSRSQPINNQYSLGVGYVFEGSALGASILKKRLKAAEMQSPSYLNLMTSSAKNRWPRYIETLGSCRDEKSVVAGAVDAFEFIISQAELAQ